MKISACLKSIFPILLLSLLAPAFSFAAAGEKAMVATADPRASKAAVDVLRRGGNAVDAAIAAQWVLNVVEPHSSGIGGGGFFLFYEAESGRIYSFDGRETAPAEAFPTMFLDEKGEPYPYWPERISGGLPVGVPGTLKLLETVYARFGSGIFEFADLFVPALDYAENGFVVSSRLARFIETEKERLALFPSSRAVFFDESGLPLKEGDRLVQPDLASTFRVVAEQGSSVFYEGAIARDIARAVQQAPFHPGLISVSDLASYQVIERSPVRGSYRGYDIFGMGPPSSGGVTIQETLNILEYFTFDALSSAERISLFAQAQALAFKDRNRYLADPEAMPAAAAGLLLSEERAEDLSNRIVINDARVTLAQRLPAPEGMHTSHLSIVDERGNMVSFTTTIEHMFGSAMIVPGRGFFLNNELTDFDAVPYDEQGQLRPNAPGPGKRPRSSMSPTLVFEEGRPVMILGSPGGSRIIGAVINVLTNVVDRSMTLEQALAAPRVVNRDGATEMELELWEDEALVQQLKEWNFDLIRAVPMGNVQAVFFTEDGITGQSDPRGEGEAMGY